MRPNQNPAALEQACRLNALKYGGEGSHTIPVSQLYHEILSACRSTNQWPSRKGTLQLIHWRRTDAYRQRFRGISKRNPDRIPVEIPIDQCSDPPHIDNHDPVFKYEEINQILKHCNARERASVWSTFFDGMKLLELAQVWGITETRACGIRKRALGKMRSHIDPIPSKAA